MLKSPPRVAYTCWRTLALQTRSTNTSRGTTVPSSVATRPRRNITRSPVGWPGGAFEGVRVAGWPGVVEGGGLGAGGFCANPTGTRSPIASANSVKMRALGCIDLFQGENVSTANLVGQSVQVKANNVYKCETTPRLLTLYRSWSEREVSR